MKIAVKCCLVLILIYLLILSYISVRAIYKVSYKSHKQRVHRILCLNVGGKYRPIGRTAVSIGVASNSNDCHSIKFKRQAVIDGFKKIEWLGRRKLGSKLYTKLVKLYVKDGGVI